MKPKNITPGLLEEAKAHKFAEPFEYCGKPYRKYVIEYYPGVGRCKWGIFRDNGESWEQVGDDLYGYSPFAVEA